MSKKSEAFSKSILDMLKKIAIDPGNQIFEEEGKYSVRALKPDGKKGKEIFYMKRDIRTGEPYLWVGHWDICPGKRETEPLSVSDAEELWNFLKGHGEDSAAYRIMNYLNQFVK